MRYYFLITILVPLLCFCQSSKPTQTNSLNDLKIGKSQTGVMGELVNVEQTGNDWQLRITVVQSQQGGASAAVIPIGKEVTGILSELTLRKLDQMKSSNLASDLAEGSKCLAVLGSRNRQTNIYEIYDLILIDN